MRVSDDRTLPCACATNTTARNCAAISPANASALKKCSIEVPPTQCDTLICWTAHIGCWERGQTKARTFARSRRRRQIEEQNSECPARSRPQKARDKADGRSGSHLAGPQRQQLHPADWGERESARGSRWLDRPSLAIKETGPETWIFPIKQLFFSSSAGNKMTVSRV
jgi:hypothetical protein